MILSRGLTPIRFLQQRVIIGLAVLTSAGITATAQSKGKAMEYDPYAQIRTLSRGAKTGLSFSAAYNLSLEVVRPLSSDQTMAQAIAGVLASEQLDWQDRRKPAIMEEKLIRSLNRHLELDGAPEYLRLRQFELWKIRKLLWAEVPELVTGPSREQLKVGSRIFEDTLSPIEAYMSAGLLIFQKLNDYDYLRTESEEKEQQSHPAPPRKPGLHLEPANPRMLEFRAHMGRVARKWATTSAAVEAVRQILDEGRK